MCGAYYRAAIWNTAIGTGLLTLPWAMKASGLAMGFGIVIFMTSVAYGNAYIVINSFNKHNSKHEYCKVHTDNYNYLYFTSLSY